MNRKRAAKCVVDEYGDQSFRLRGLSRQVQIIGLRTNALHRSRLIVVLTLVHADVGRLRRNIDVRYARVFEDNEGAGNSQKEEYVDSPFPTRIVFANEVSFMVHCQHGPDGNAKSSNQTGDQRPVKKPVEKNVRGYSDTDKVPERICFLGVGLFVGFFSVMNQPVDSYCKSSDSNEYVGNVPWIPTEVGICNHPIRKEWNST